MRKAQNNSIHLGHNAKFHGDTVIGPNAKLHKNYNDSMHFDKSKIGSLNINNYNNSKSVNYKGNKSDMVVYSTLAPFLIKKVGEKKITATGIVSNVVGIVQLFLWGYQYVPNFTGWFAWSSVPLIFLGMFLLSVVKYSRDAKCKDCNKEFAYIEHENPDLEEVKVHNGTRITTHRKFKCKFCNHEYTTQSSRLVEDTSFK